MKPDAAEEEEEEEEERGFDRKDNYSTEPGHFFGDSTHVTNMTTRNHYYYNCTVKLPCTISGTKQQ
jgi:hypothetical protein